MKAREQVKEDEEKKQRDEVARKAAAVIRDYENTVAKRKAQARDASGRVVERSLKHFRELLAE